MAEVAARQAGPAPRPLCPAPRELRDPGARDGQRQRRAAQGRDDPARHRHHDRGPGPIVPADQPLGDRAERRHDRGLALPAGGHDPRVRRRAGNRRRAQLRRHAAVPPRRRLGLRPRARARGRGARGARLELPAGQAHSGRSRDLRRDPQEIPARLLPIGDGPLRSQAERLAREGGFEDRTTFLGNVPAIETTLPAAKVMLLLPRTPSPRPRGARGDGVRRPGGRQPPPAACPRSSRTGAAATCARWATSRRWPTRRSRCYATPSCGAVSRGTPGGAPSRSSRKTGWSSGIARSTSDARVFLKIQNLKSKI